MKIKIDSQLVTKNIHVDKKSENPNDLCEIENNGFIKIMSNEQADKFLKKKSRKEKKLLKKKGQRQRRHREKQYVNECITAST